jgi:hypothetical protein
MLVMLALSHHTLLWIVLAIYYLACFFILLKARAEMPFKIAFVIAVLLSIPSGIEGLNQRNGDKFFAGFLGLPFVVTVGYLGGKADYESVFPTKR